MGGEWDSTNVADGQVAVFTPIALDHQSRLGSTIAEIARTKSGIIKPAAAVVTAKQPDEALAVLEDAAELTESTLAVEGDAFAVLESRVAVGGQLVSIRGLAGEYRDVALPLFGRHQAENAAVAIAAVEAFIGGGIGAPRRRGRARRARPPRPRRAGCSPRRRADGDRRRGAQPARRRGARRRARRVLRLRRGRVRVRRARRQGRRRASSPCSPARAARSSSRDPTPTAPRRRRPRRGRRRARRRRSRAAVERLDDALDDARAWAAEAPKRAVVVTGSIALVGEAMAIAADRGWGRDERRQRHARPGDPTSASRAQPTRPRRAALACGRASPRSCSPSRSSSSSSPRS